MPRTFKVDNDIVDIPDENVKAFLSDYPNASEMKSFIVDKDTVDIPLNNVNMFINDYPNAKPLYETKPVKKMAFYPGNLVPAHEPAPIESNVDSIKQRYKSDIEKHPYLQTALNAFYQGKLIGKGGIPIQKLVDEYFTDKKKSEFAQNPEEFLNKLNLSETDKKATSSNLPEMSITIAESTLPSKVPEEDQKKVVAEFIGKTLFDIPFMVAASEINPLEGLNLLKGMGKTGRSILSDVGFGATYGSIKGENPLQDAAIFAGFGLFARGLGGLSKKVVPIYESSKTIEEATDKILEKLSPEEAKQFVDFWGNVQNQPKRLYSGNQMPAEGGFDARRIADETIKRSVEKKAYTPENIVLFEKPANAEEQLIKPDITADASKLDRPVTRVTSSAETIIENRLGKGPREVKGKVVYTPEAKIEALGNRMDDTDAIKIGESLKGNKGAIKELRLEELRYTELAKKESDYVKKFDLIKIKDQYRQAREAAEGVGSATELANLEETLAQGKKAEPEIPEPKKVEWTNTDEEEVSDIVVRSKERTVEGNLSAVERAKVSLKNTLGKTGEQEERTGVEYLKGIAQSLKDDVIESSKNSLRTGLPLPTSYENLGKFLRENKLKLSEEERRKLIRYSSEVINKSLSSDDKMKLIEDYIAKNVTTLERTPQVTPMSDPLPEVEINVSQPKISSVKNFVRHYFKSGGNKPSVLHQEEILARGKIQEKSIAFNNLSKELKSQIKKSGDQTLKTNEGLGRIDSYLKRESDGSDLPENVRLTADKMRVEIDNLSWELANSNIVGDELGLTIEENMGEYVTRSYQKFIDKNYKPNDDVYNKAYQLYNKLVPEELVGELPGLNYVSRRIKLANAGFDNIQSIATATPEALVEAVGKEKFTLSNANAAIAEAQRIVPEIPNRVTGQIEFLLNKDLDRANFGKMYNIGKVNLSSLKQRKEIDQVVRDLYGEIKDPFINFNITANRISSMLENRKMLENVRDFNENLADGNPEKFFYRKPFDRFSVKVSAEGNKAIEPLDGVYTTPEIYKEITQIGNNKELGTLMHWYSTINGFAKYSKTVLSPITVSRNFTGNIGFAIMNGHYRVEMLPKSIKIILGGSKGSNAELYNEAVRLGVIKDNIYAGELQAMLKDMGLRMDTGGFVTAQGLKKLQKYSEKTLKNGLKGATELYQAMDDIWKLYGWQNERVLGKSAEEAAQIVRTTYPTYSELARFTQGLHRAPLVGTFFSFPAAVVMVGKNATKMAFADASRGNFRRLIGLSSAIGLTTGGATYLGDRGYKAYNKYIKGKDNYKIMSEEEYMALRQFAAPWEKNSQLQIVERTPEEISFIDLGYTDPFSVVSDGYRAIRYGSKEGKIDEAMYDAAKNFLEPFLSEGLVSQKIMDWARNKKADTGGQVYNPEAPLQDQAADVLLHGVDAVAPPLTPEIGSQAKRLENALKKEVTDNGRKAKLYQEFMNTATGVRVRTINIKQSFRWSIGDIKKRLEDAENQFYRPVYKEGSKIADVAKGRRKAENSRKKIFNDFQQIIHAGRVLGLNDADMFMIIKENKMGITGASWFYGNYLPLMEGPNTIIEGVEKFGGDYDPFGQGSQ